MNFLAHCLIALKAGDLSPDASSPNAEKAGGANLPTSKCKQAEELSPSFGSGNLPPSRNANELASFTELTDGLVAGGLLGDFIKGPVPSAWPNALQLGVRLHRRIDAYSNAAPGIKRSCNRFPPELRRFAPIFVDIIADHCLALDWADHHPTELPAFSARCYALAAAEAQRLHGDGRRYLNWLIERDLMSGYRDYEVMERGLKSVTRRLARQHLDASLLDFVAGALPSLREDFQDYFPLLAAHGRGYVEECLSKRS